MRIAIAASALVIAGLGDVVSSFSSSSYGGSVVDHNSRTSMSTTSALKMGLFDGFKGQGSGKDDLDEQWEAQQEILRNRRKPKSERDAYFAQVEERRMEASKKQESLWGWQTKKYEKGEDPIDEWRKQRAAGNISDLNDQYGDPKKVGGIPLPMASFGVGGEFGVGGKFDNGGRFDLRLPYADQGYVDDDADLLGKLGSMFGGKKKQATTKESIPQASKIETTSSKKGAGPTKKAAVAKKAAAEAPKKPSETKKQGGWPW